MSNTDPLSDQTLAEWLSICEKAAPAPWKVCGANEGRCSCGNVFGSGGEACVCSMTNVEEADPAYVDAQRADNATFIAAAREGWPRTIKELIAAKAGIIEERRDLTTQMAGLIEENESLRKRLEEAEARLSESEQLVCDFQAASMLTVGSDDPAEVTPAHVEKHVTSLRAEVDRLRAAARSRSHCRSCQRGDLPVNGVHHPVGGEVTETMCAEPELAKLLAPIYLRDSQRET